MYKLGGFTGDLDPSSSMLVSKLVERLVSEPGAGSAPTMPAARYPTVILAALELYCMNTSVPPFKRIHSGFLLFKAWGTLRFDDVQRIKRQSLRRVGSMVQTTLQSSKTSGPGKRMKELPVGVSVEAHLLGLPWLTTVLSLHTKFLPEPQDVLMERCTDDFQKFTGKELRYS